MEFTINTPAKINLALKVLGRRSDGYHELMMVMQAVGIYDTVALVPAESGGISLETDRDDIPAGPGNLAYRAAQLLKDEFGVKAGIHICLRKRIPSAAGLGGGSSDAAAVLKGLNRLWGLGLSAAELERLGARIGADVPFFIKGGCSAVGGIGEKVEPLAHFQVLPLVVVKPALDISTRWVYNMYDSMVLPGGSRRDPEEVVRAVEAGDAARIARCMFNDLAPVVCRFYPVINEIYGQMLDSGALGALMSGSGSAVFGIYAATGEARKAAEALKRPGSYQVFQTTTVGEEEETLDEKKACFHQT